MKYRIAPWQEVPPGTRKIPQGEYYKVIFGMLPELPEQTDSTCLYRLVATDPVFLECDEPG